LPCHCILHEPSEKLNFVNFPNAGLVSLVVAMEDGKTVEAAMAQDRVDGGSILITHDFLATMLGTDLPSVRLAAGILQRKKNIEYTRGTVLGGERKW